MPESVIFNFVLNFLMLGTAPYRSYGHFTIRNTSLVCLLLEYNLKSFKLYSLRSSQAPMLPITYPQFDVLGLSVWPLDHLSSQPSQGLANSHRPCVFWLTSRCPSLYKCHSLCFYSEIITVPFSCVFTSYFLPPPPGIRQSECPVFFR